VQRFAKADLIAFTTYPGIVFADPNDIPDAYYAELPQRTAKPIAFSEIGWPSSLGAAGWQSSEEEQARFVTRFFELTRTLEPRIAIWSFLYDQSLADPFRGIGLLRPDGTKRPAWQAWNDAR
jgi:hypothetical protein